MQHPAHRVNICSREAGGGSFGILAWQFASLMYLFTSDTVAPIDKIEFLWRYLAGPLNFLGI